MSIVGSLGGYCQSGGARTAMDRSNNDLDRCKTAINGNKMGLLRLLQIMALLGVFEGKI